MFFGSVLIIIGLGLLLQNLGFIAGGFWDIAWPVTFMALGVAVIVRRSPRHGPWCSCGRCRGVSTPP